MNLFELMATISLNTSEYDKGIDDVQSGADTANAAMESIDTDPAEEGLEDVGEAADSAGEDLGEFSDEANDVDLSEMGDELEGAGDDLDELGETAGSAGEDLEALGASAGSAGADIEDFANTAEGADISAIGDDASAAASDIDEMAGSASDAESDIESMGDSADSAGGDVGSMGDDASSAAGDLDELASSADDAAASMDDLGESASGAVDGVEGLGGSLSGTMVSGSTEATNAMSGFNEAIDGFKTGGLVGGVVASISAIGTGIYNMATETQDASAIIAQGTGATGDTLEEFTTIAKDALADVKLSAETDLASVADTLAETNTRFGLTGDELQDTTTKMEDFAAVTGQSGVDAVDAIADVYGKWNLSSEDIPGLLDDITVASQNSKVSASELEKIISKNAQNFTDLGMSVEDSTAFVAAYTQAGGDANELNSILKSSVNNLVGEVDDVPGTFNEAIKTIQECGDEDEALTATIGDTGLTIQDVFGSKANTLVQACQSGTFSLEDMEEALQNSDGAMESTADASVTFKDKVQGAFNTLKDGCRNAWQNIKGFFSNTKETGEEAGQGLVEGLDESAADVEEAGKGVGQAVIDGASDTLETHSPSKVMESIGGDVTTGLTNGLGDMGSKVQGIFSGVLGNITSFGSDAKKESTSTGTGFVSNMKSGLSNLASTVASPLKSATSEITSFDSSSTKEASSTGNGFVSNLKSGLSTVVNTVHTPLTDAIGKVTGWSSDMSKESSSSASGFVDKMKTGLSNMSSEVKAKLDPVTQTSSRWGDTLATEFNGMGKNVINGIIGGIGSMVGNLYSSIQNALSGLVGKAKNALGISSPSRVFRDEIGLMIGEGLALGISDSTGEVEDAIDDMISATQVGDIPIGSATMDVEGGGQVAAWNDNFDKLFDLLGQYLPALANMQMVTDTGALVGELSAPMNKALGQISAKEARR